MKEINGECNIRINKNVEKKIIIVTTHHAFTIDANVHAIGVAFGAILDFVRELNHDCFLAVELQSVSGVVRKCLFDGRFLPEPIPRVLHRLLATTDQSARPARIVMWIPFQQLSAVWHIVERGALLWPEIARIFAGLQPIARIFLLERCFHSTTWRIDMTLDRFVLVSNVIIKVFNVQR